MLTIIAYCALGHGAMVSPTTRNAIERSLPDFSNGRSPVTPCTCANGLEKPHFEEEEVLAEGKCFLDPGMNYNSHANNIHTMHANTPSTCCDFCGTTEGCTFWTFVDEKCYLKNATIGRSSLSGATSGGIGPKPHFPTPAPRPEGCNQGTCLTAAGGTAPITGTAPHADKAGFRTRYCNASFNSAGAPVPMINATLPKVAWTMNMAAVEGSVNDSYKFNPWRAPGYAPVVDPCGQAGGKYKQTPMGGDSAYYTTNNPAHALPVLVWNNGTRFPIEGIFVSEGTWPLGSTWARNPIPRVNDDNKGLADFAGCPGPDGKSGKRCIQFPAPCPQDVGRYPWSEDGSGQGACSGKYLLSWRWDAEETAQVWQNCADITITA
eukprot:gene19178-3946_t